MPRATRAAAASCALAALVAAASSAAGSTATAAPAGSGTTDLVLSVGSGFSAAHLPAGVTLRRSLPHVGAVVVSAPADAADDLAALRGVRGVRADHALAVVDRGVTDAGAVLAPQAVGGKAGKAGAGAGVTVALVDTGVADTAALARSSGRLVAGTDTSEDAAGAPRDGHGHGTFMAGLIAGGQVGRDVIGVAPAATVVDVKVAQADGTTSLSKVLAGFDWVVANRSSASIDVMSLSLAADRPQEGYGRDPLTDGVEAVKKAGITVLVATGNTAGEVGDPAQDPYIIAVGAADTRGKDAATAAFSGSGDVFGMPRPDVVAPGVSVVSVLPPSSVVAQGQPQASLGGGLYKGSGTSQATAVAAGAVAVFLGQEGAVSPDHVRASLGWYATDLPGDADGAGLLAIPKKVETQPGPRGQGGQATGSQDPEPAASSWSASSWSASSWSRATSWSATSWSASSWSATSWSATSWSATSWSRATSWSATSWSATSWSAGSW